jgi:hypothetical protein
MWRRLAYLPLGLCSTPTGHVFLDRENMAMFYAGATFTDHPGGISATGFYEKKAIFWT